MCGIGIEYVLEMASDEVGASLELRAGVESGGLSWIEVGLGLEMGLG